MKTKEKTLTIPDIRNKLSPLTTLISLLETGETECALNCLKQCKKSINYLADRKVYK